MNWNLMYYLSSQLWYIYVLWFIYHFISHLISLLYECLCDCDCLLVLVWLPIISDCEHQVSYLLWSIKYLLLLLLLLYYWSSKTFNIAKYMTNDVLLFYTYKFLYSSKWAWVYRICPIKRALAEVMTGCAFIYLQKMALYLSLKIIQV